MKPVGISIVLLALIHAFTSYLKLEFWMLPLFLLLFLFTYGLLLILTKSFDREDIDMILAIEKRVGVSLGAIKKILKRFI